MAIDKTSICNMALVHIGKDLLTDVDTDTSKLATHCRLFFEQVRDRITSEGEWRFATTRADLGLLSAAPEFGFSYQHQLPTNCLVVLEINDEVPDAYDYMIEGRKLLSDLSAVKIRYLKKETDVSQWSSGFTEAFSIRLAAKLAYTFKGDKMLARELLQLYEIELRKALAIEGQQGSNRSFSTRDLTEVR